MIRWNLSGNAIAQRIKATLGITGLSLPRVHIDGVVWHLDVGSSHPGAEVGPKGLGCSPIKAVRELGSERRDSSVPIRRGRRISERSCPWHERTGMDGPLVYLLQCQLHGRVAKSGRDKR